jgi:hypothetical protein
MTRRRNRTGRVHSKQLHVEIFITGDYLYCMLYFVQLARELIYNFTSGHTPQINYPLGEDNPFISSRQPLDLQRLTATINHNSNDLPSMTIS